MPLLPEGAIDTLGYLDTVQARPERVAEVLETGPVEDLDAAAIDHVLVATSAELVVAADLVAAVAAASSPAPVVPLGVGAHPASLGPRSLLLVLGEDPALGSPGRDAGATVVQLAGQEAHLPRLGTSGVAVRALLVLEQLGLVPDVTASATAAVAQLRRRRDEAVAGRDGAARLARRVGRTLPLVHGAGAVGGAAARAWARQVNLSAKAAAFHAALPDLATAEISGWGQHGDMTRQVFTRIQLRHDHEPPGTDALLARVDPMLDEVVHERHVVTAAGDGLLAQLLDLVFQGDLFAHHLAQELEIDPGPTAAVAAIWSVP